MYKLCFFIGDSSNIVLALACSSTLLLSAAFIVYRKKIPLHQQQKLVIQQQSSYIESLYHQLNYLYGGLFELEQLLDDVIEQISDELDYQYTIEQKNRIVKHTKFDVSQ